MEDSLDSFKPMQLDVFYAMWGPYDDEPHGTRPPTISTESERDALKRAHSLSDVPVGTVVWREFVQQ